MFGYRDAAVLFKSNLGPDVSNMVQTLLLLGAESNFVRTRDVTKIFAGTYAMQGADFCAVVQGSFDTDAILGRSVDARAVSRSRASRSPRAATAETDPYSSRQHRLHPPHGPHGAQR